MSDLVTATAKDATKPDPAWSTSPERSSFVELPSFDCKLEVHIAGPPRKDPKSQPLVVLEHGHAGSLYEWPAVFREISQFARVLCYSRAGYGLSTRGPSAQPRTIPNLCIELRKMLQTIGQEPPYVILGHSLGGIIARQYLHMYSSEVAGMVLADSYCVGTPPPSPGLLDTILGPGGQETFRAVIGVTEHTKLSTDEMVQMINMDNLETAHATAEAEMQYLRASAAALNEAQGFHREDGKMWFDNQPMGDKRLSVIAGGMSNDLSKAYENAKKQGYGTEDDLKAMQGWVQAWRQNEGPSRGCALDLSRQSRLAEGEGPAATHAVHIIAPDLLAKEVRWVLGVDENKIDL